MRGEQPVVTIGQRLAAAKVIWGPVRVVSYGSVLEQDDGMDVPALRHVVGMRLVPEAPAGVVCWTGRLAGESGVPVNVILDGESMADLDVAFADLICADAERFLTIAAATAGLTGDPARWDPEMTFRSGQSWEVRFTEAPAPTELGLLVIFTGAQVTEIDDLADWDDA